MGALRRAQQLQLLCKLQELNYRINFSERFGFIYVETPKVGCTTLKASFQLAEGVTHPEGADGHLQIHDKGRSPLLSPSDNFRMFFRYLHSREIFRFAFVRNPYSRLLSAYLQKISLRSEILERDDREDRCRRLNLPQKDEVSFEQFARAVASSPPHLLDMHWRQQTLLTLPGLISYSFVGRFENFADDVRYVCDRLGMAHRKIVVRQEHRTQASEHLRRYYTPEIQSIVHTAYKMDFETFGYARELPE